jgi:putative ATPase
MRNEKNLSLFTNIKSKKPLADEVRPKKIEEVFGQEHILDHNSQMRDLLESGNLHNMILWGPPGSGKTTIARIIIEQNKDKYHTEIISAVINNTSDIKQIFLDAISRKEQGINTILLVDEIHRFNRAQQDIFLPYLEDGTIILIGATTENPSFELNSALLSRCITYTLKRLDRAALSKITERVEKIFGKKLPLTEDAKEKLYEIVDGDGRYFLNIYEGLINHNNKSDKLLEPEGLETYIQKRMPIYDKSKEAHYNLISALHKSLRGSDCNASLYWLLRMLEGGEDPHYILRRLVRVASEDVGLADPNAIQQVLAAREAYDFLGSPEGELAIIQAVIYLATAPKSNALYVAEKEAKKFVKQYGSLPPPKTILNAPTNFMKDQGYGKGYIYDHNTPECYSGQDYFPEEVSDDKTNFYRPTSRGYEKDITKRIKYWYNLRIKIKNQ